MAEGRRPASRWMILSAVVALAAAALSGLGAFADHIVGGSSWTYAISPTTPNTPVQTTSFLDAGAALPFSLAYHNGPGLVVAHADSVAGVPASPVTPKPNNQDVVSQIVSVGDFTTDGCAAADTTGPDTAALYGFWDEPFIQP
jgi:hypothetical protein